MIGIQEIGEYFPSYRENNHDIHDDPEIIKKIGIESRTQKSSDEQVLDMCLKAFENLKTKMDVSHDMMQIDMVILITQNPDINIPHTAAMIHGALELPESCACFDVSLGCSGFVYGLSIVKSFLESNDLSNALLFTCDPYSKIINREDKNTKMIFGDAAAVTLVSNNNPVLDIGRFTFGTQGKKCTALTMVEQQLYMDGRGIFNFVSTKIPNDIKNCLIKNDLSLEDIDRFIFHPGSKYMIDSLVRRMKLDNDKVPFLISEYGNTVSSSIPLMLVKFLQDRESKKILISGFGVGLSWASTALKRIN